MSLNDEMEVTQDIYSQVRFKYNFEVVKRNFILLLLYILGILEDSY